MQFNQGTGVFTANQTRIFDLALGLLGHNNSIVKEDQMSLEGLLILLLIGLIAGWLAGIVMKGGGYGIVGDIIIGILGSLVGAWRVRFPRQRHCGIHWRGRLDLHHAPACPGSGIVR